MNNATPRATTGMRIARLARMGTLASTMALGLAAANLHAQDYPSRPVRVFVANSSGSLADILSRLVFTRLSVTLGQTFPIDNRPGAGGSLAGETAAKAAPDGYTLLYASDSTLTIGPWLYPALGYDPVKDFAPVSMVAKIPTGLVAHPSLGVRNLQEFIAHVRAHPGKLNYSSGGTGHATHLGMEIFLARTGLQMVHVPYKGTGPALQAVLAGEVAASDLGLGIVLSAMQDKRLTSLAVVGPRGEGVLPGVPELGSVIPEAEYVSWQAVFAPAKTPRAIIDRLHDALASAMNAPEVRTRMQEIGMSNVSSTPEELAAIVVRDLRVNGEMVRKLGLRAD